MRYEGGNGYSILFPEIIGYAGMPMIVKVANKGDYIGAGITIKIGDEYYTETRQIYNDTAIFDIARYAQKAFINKSLGYNYRGNASKIETSELSQTIQFTVKFTKSDGTTVNSNQQKVEVLYGYITPTQSNGGTRKRKWFVKYPMSVDFYAVEDTSICIDIDGNKEYPTMPPTRGKQCSCVYDFDCEQSPQYPK